MNPAALAAACNGDLANAIAASTHGGIERQEVEGQCAMVASSHLPKEMRGTTREQLEAKGFIFGADVDDLFVAVTLPAGWSLKATDHSMHSDLLDAAGRVRAGIFYKAAFYDRKASLSMRRRYTVESWRSCDVAGIASERGDEKFRIIAIYDAGTELHRFGIAPDADWAKAEELTKHAEAHLAEQFPNHADAMAYWDEDAGA